MGKCKVCDYCHPQPGEKTCRFATDAINKAKNAGEEELWRNYLDTTTLNTFPQDVKTEHGGAGAVVSDTELRDRMDELVKRFDDMSSQFKTVLQRLPANPTATASTLPIGPSGVASLVTPTPLLPPVIIPVSCQPTAVTTSTPVSVLAGSPMTSSTMAGRPHTSVSYGISNTGLGQAPPVIPSYGYSCLMGSSTVTSSGMSGTAGTSVSGIPTRPPPFMSTSTAPAGWLSDPLTSALQQLSSVVDPESVSRTAGMALRPEFYVQHCLHNIPLKSVDYRKLSYRSLIHGMICVARHLSQTGANVDSYLAHMEFLTRHANDNSYVDLAYSEYDHNVVDRFLKNPLVGFPVADPVALGYSFHPAKLANDIDVKQQNVAKRKKVTGKQNRPGGIPEGYPESNCFFWNYKSCWNNSCAKKHVCRLCEGSHRAVGCPRDKSV